MVHGMRDGCSAPEQPLRIAVCMRSPARSPCLRHDRDTGDAARICAVALWLDALGLTVAGPAHPIASSPLRAMMLDGQGSSEMVLSLSDVRAARLMRRDCATM